MKEGPEDSRERGVEFGPLAEQLREETYPLSHADLLDRYGNRDIVLQDGTTTVEQILGPENELEYEDSEDVRQSIFSMVGDRAIGREGYSDRGGNPEGLDTLDRPESF